MKVGDKWIVYGHSYPKYTIIEKDGRLHWSWVKDGEVDSWPIAGTELSGEVTWGRRYINFNDYYEKIQT